MKGSETKLISYMQGASKRFVIPVYQRSYNWKTENCKRLYDDLIKVVHNNRKSHFFGSIVSVYNPDGMNDEFLIIDGQQRLTTVSLLLLAIYNILENKLITAQKTLSERIYEEYLVDKWQDKDTRIKLKPVKNDSTAFSKLFDDASEYIPDSNLTINYNYFYSRIQKEEISIDALFEAICRLEIISITLNQDDNPQLIFESLNSTGVALSEGDKIRNFILMGKSISEQNLFYEKYWRPIEVCTNDNVSAFIRDYLSVKQQVIPSQSKVYFSFKDYVEEKQLDMEVLLKDLLAYAKWYAILLSGKAPDRRIRACINRLNRLETTVTRPFFLEVLRMEAEAKLTINEVAEVFLTTENYLFRRTICDLPTNALNKIFLLLHKEIVRYDNTENNYVEKLKYALLSKKERARFPGDKEFVESFTERQVYLMNSKNKVYILEKFENNATIEDKDVYRHVDNGEYSIEHIMPQHLTPAWVEALGPDYNQIHETWLHRLANLTLTAYNSKYSNSPFLEKRDMRNGFRESGIRLNTYIARKENWGLAELEERNHYLMKTAIEIWTEPSTSYKPEEKQMDSCALDDEVNLSGRVIVKFSYKNIEQPVTSWIDMYERMLKILHGEDKSVLSKLAYTTDSNVELAPYVSYRPTDLRSYIEIEDGIYVERNTSTWMKVSLLRRLFKLYNAVPGDLIFYLRDEEVVDTEALAGARFELRRRYWAYALDFIKREHGESGSFSNVSPSKENYINGFFGIGGFSISCIANYDSARVEIRLEKANKQENKAAFDMLKANKLEIENKLGIELGWNRGDETKVSKVYYQLDDVGIDKEADWMQMAKFHAEWSKRFYDIIVPYLAEKLAESS